MDATPLGRLRLSRRRAVAHRSLAPEDPRFRHRAPLPIPDRAGHADAGLGQDQLAHARALAILAAPIRPAVGARRLAAVAQAARSACDEYLTGRRVHVVQISFFVDPERRSPERLLHDWYTLEDIAAAVASAGERVTVV